MTIGEVARGRQRLGTGEQQLDGSLRWRGLWKQPQGRTQPTRSAPGRKPCCRLARLPQDIDGGEVALARRSLDVVRPPRGCQSSGCKYLGAPLVGSEPPAASGRLVHRAPDERVSEAKAAGTSVARMRSRCCSSSTASIAATSEIAAAAAASSGSNGSPATAAPSSAMRPPFDSSASSSFSEAATAGGHRCQSVKPREQRRFPPRGRATSRAARGRTGCHHTPCR